MPAKRCIHCRKKLRKGEVMVCLSCSLDDATEMAETEARKMQERRRKRLFVTFVVLFVVLFVSAVVAVVVWRGNGSSDEPVQMRATPPTSIRAPSVSHEITLPHGMNTMLVRGNASIVAEPVARGESMIESPDALDNDLITVVFSDVIRDRARDFFGPYQSTDDRFVFLRYHRLGDDNDGAFIVQGGEAVEGNEGVVLFWEPPHLFSGFPWCYLLSWNPGEELLYRCLGNTREVQKDTSQREWKYEYHFAIAREETNAYVFSRSCRPNEMEGACSTYTEEVRDPFADACGSPLRNISRAEDFADPVLQKFYRTIIRDVKREQLMEACRSSIDGRERIVFLSSYPRNDGVTMVRVGEYDARRERVVIMKTHEYHEPFCEIREWIPEVLLRYECSNPAVAITPDQIPVTEYQWDMNLDYATARICRGVSFDILLTERRDKKCTPRKPI